MAGAIELLRTIARAPLRTMRFTDIRHLGSNTWRQLADLVDRGALLRLAHGVYTAPPEGRDAREWRPGLESTGLAVATARHGDRQAILMGIGAARHWGAVPRAIGSTTIAVPAAGRRSVTVGAGQIHFIQRNLEQVQAVLEHTELGPALVTTPEQTLFDLLMRPHQGGAPDIAHTGARQLQPQVGPEEFTQLVSDAPRANATIRQAALTLGARR